MIVQTKFTSIVVGVLGVATIAVITDSSPWTPWFLGGILTVLTGILGMLYKQQGRMSVLETQVTPLWTQMQLQVSEALHHPHPEDQEMDKLLEKLNLLTITSDERARLDTLLNERMTDPKVGDQEKKQAELLLFVIKRVVEEGK